jgi:hypothetical protein
MKALLFLSLLLTFQLRAQSLEQKELNFRVNAEVMLKGELHFSFQVISPEGLLKLLPSMQEFDSLGLLNDRKASLLVNKFSYVVKKPVGFFDQRTLEDEKFISAVLAPARAKKISTTEFVVSVPGATPYHYRLMNYFDSDDITTASNAKIGKSVTAIKKIDVLAQSASSIFLHEMTNYSLMARGGLKLEAYIPLKEERTLVIGFQVISLQDYKANSSGLKAQTLKEFERQQALINAYKPE